MKNVKYFIKSCILSKLRNPQLIFRCKKGLLLTFDDGPKENLTSSILDVLKDFNVPAMFFHTGVNIKKNMHLSQLCVEKGHEIGNHSYGHDNPKKLSREAFFCDYRKSQKIIQSILQKDNDQFYRPPEGGINIPLIKYWRDLELKVMLWSKDFHDFDRRTDYEILINRCNNFHFKSGDIVLMHETPSTVKALPSILKHIIEKYDLPFLSSKEAL